MKRSVHHLSLFGNVLLVVGLALAAGWMWKGRQSYAAVEQTSKQHDRRNEIYETFINNIMYADTFVGRAFPKMELVDIQGRKVSTDFSDKKAGLVLLLTDKSCQPCLTAQLKATQRIYDSLSDPQQFPIYAVFKAPAGQITRLTRAFNLQYPLIADEQGALVNDDLAETAPIVYFVNKDNAIVKCHVPQIGTPVFSMLFYQQLHTVQLQKHLNIGVRPNKADFGLGEYEFVDILMNQFDHPEIRMLLW